MMGTGSGPVISVDAISKTFWIPSVRRETVREHVFAMLRPRRFQELRVLDGVSLDVHQGETLGIMGRNGSGKSTLLKILCGIYPPDRGRVTVRAPITPILELGLGWNPDLDAIDNVMLIGAVMGLPLSEIRSDMDEILAFAEVEQFARLHLKHYSSGMMSRLAYAVAFRTVREVLILDEVFAVGDAGFKAKCVQRYQELRDEGKTVIVVSHDSSTVETHCDRALLIDAGRVVANGLARDVAAQYQFLLTGGQASSPG